MDPRLNDSTLTNTDAVDEISIGAGVALSRWFGHEARRVYAMFVESDEDRADRELIELIRRIEAKDQLITPRTLQQASRKFKTADAARQALQHLADAGYGTLDVSAPPSGGGRQSVVFTPVYTSTVYDRPTDAIENAATVDVDTVDTSETEGVR